jgi:hypothetical protein
MELCDWKKFWSPCDSSNKEIHFLSSKGTFHPALEGLIKVTFHKLKKITSISSIFKTIIETWSIFQIDIIYKPFKYVWPLPNKKI